MSNSRILRVATTAISLAIGTFLMSCGDPKTMPFLGTWNGGFVVEKVQQGPDTAGDRKRHELRGYLRMVLNKKKYEMKLDGEQQTVLVKGLWTYNGKQLTLEPESVEIKVEGGDENLDPNKKSLPSDELYSNYLKKMTFNLKSSSDRSGVDLLSGLDSTVVFLQGKHQFQKELLAQ